jgi:pyruvate,water dikinase
MKNFVLSLSDTQADLAMVGGKGMSLAKLARAGLPVPGGFHVTTEAYRTFVAANGLQGEILKALEKVDGAQPATSEAASVIIGKLFEQAVLPDEIAAVVRQAYEKLAKGAALPVAVRSSATAEDLPDASFAGQQDTYLNICGTEAVLAAVKKCWASLWTGRAIAYRLRQNIAPDQVALAVVVQQLVLAEAAGILFTANPLNSRRNELLINASWGLGEAIVGGLVTPDTLTLDKVSGRLLKCEIASKELMTVRTETGTEERPVSPELKQQAVLSDKQAAELAGYGLRIETLYGTPMDIEWTLANGQFAIVQARPITTLGEAPLEWKLPHPKGVYMRASVVDLMPDPLSPLFASLGIPALVAQMAPVGKIMTGTEPVLPEGYFTTINHYAYMNASFSGRSWAWILFSMLPSYPRMLKTLVPYWREQAYPRYKRAAAELENVETSGMDCRGLLQTAQKAMNAAAYYIAGLMFATMGASAGSEKLFSMVYEKLVKTKGDPGAEVLLMGWDSLPVKSEKSLFDLAAFCQQQPGLMDYVQAAPSAELAGQLKLAQALEDVPAEAWVEFSRRFKRHLERFGYMLFDLDFAKALPREHPEPMLEAVKMYVRGEGTNPYERQTASQERRVNTKARLLERLKGPRRWAFLKTLNWAQSLAEVREDALAEIGLVYPVLRRVLLSLGERLVKSGALALADDIFWLELAELELIAAEADQKGTAAPQQALVQERRRFWQQAKQNTPPPMLPARKTYMGMDTQMLLAESEGSQEGKTLKGVAASQGKVSAPACVLHGPQDFERMRPGDVLVAGTTTPAWTPLFAMASAVVTDIGGPLSHGSIVAREYGIPAVMGTGIATRRIHDGQRITVDGSSGTVTLE